MDSSGSLVHDCMIARDVAPPRKVPGVHMAEAKPVQTRHTEGFDPMHGGSIGTR